MSTLVQENPFVSVIVPARNEEACLAACLESLVVQAGVAFEIIVVDDGSTDQTREIASGFPGIEVLDAGPLPAGWTGKNNAMWQGAKRAKGKWLLFTDADTIHKPGSLARAVGEAEQQGATLLSYSPQQEVRGFWEKVVMPVIFAELALAYPPTEVNNPASGLAAANGQYLMILHTVYDELQGHAAIRSDLLEDVALARLVKSSQRKIFFRYGGDRVRTRMYRKFRQLREGWTKNLALLFPQARALALRRLLEFASIMALGGSLLFGLLVRMTYFMSSQVADQSYVPHASVSLLYRWLTGILVILLVYLLARFFRRTKKAHFPSTAVALSLLGLPIFSYLLLRSRHLYKKGRLAWKERTYIYSAEGTGRLSTQDVSRALRS